MARILIADDNPVIRRLLIYILQLDNHEVVVASDGLQAWELLQSESVDLAILDLDMPEASGIEVLSWIRGDPAYTDLPVVMLTASGQDEDEAIAKEQRVSLFLTKPFGSRDLRSQISGLLGG